MSNASSPRQKQLGSLFACVFATLLPVASASALAAHPVAPMALSQAAAAKLGLAVSRVGIVALDVRDGSADQLFMVLPMEGNNVHLTLSRHSLRSPEFALKVQDAGGQFREVVAPAPDTWRGRVNGEPSSRAVAARVAGEWHMRIVHAIDGGSAEAWSVTPLRDVLPDAPAGMSLVVRESDAPAVEGTCEVKRSSPPMLSPPHSAEDLNALSPSQVQACEIACDTDVEFYVANGSSVTNTVADIEAVMALTTDIFEFDVQLTLQIVTLIVRTIEPDPYSTTNPYALLEALRSEWQLNHSGIARDIVHLFSGHDLDGSTIGIAYGDPGVCNYYAYSIVQSRYSTTMARRAALSAHELGHNFDAVHCDYDDYSCRIMCSSSLKCAAGNHSFGPTEVTLIRAHMARLTCLMPATIDVPHATLPFSESFAGTLPDAAKWTAADQVYVSYGYLQLNHGGGYSPEFYLGTIRTLPIMLTGRATTSFKARSINVAAGQHLHVEYFNTSSHVWVMLRDIVAPGGTTAYAIYADTLPASAAGDWFALRFSAWGGTGSTSTDWYVDDVTIGETTLDVAGEQTLFTRLEPAFPNPTHGRASLRYGLRADSHLHVTIFDAGGARVRSLFDGDQRAGTLTVAWDGRDAHGVAVPAGIYVARLEALSESRSTRFAVIR